MERKLYLLILLLFCSAAQGTAQDSVDVSFYYANPSVAGVSLVGEFNAWNNATSPMTNVVGGLWRRTVRLKVGGNTPQNVAGAYQYKFYYSGASPWPNDPLNHHVNLADNSNTFVYTKDPTFYQILPNQRQALVTTATPTITAYVYPKVGATVDTASIVLVIDGTPLSGLGAFYDPATCKFSYPVSSPLQNGGHTMIIRASSSAGGANADTVTFATQGGYVQISNQGGYVTRSTQRTLYGIVPNGSVASVSIVRNQTDSTTVPVLASKFSATMSLAEGLNTFLVRADSSGTLVSSLPVSITRLVDHAPSAAITFFDGGSSIQLQAAASTDPDSGQTQTLTFSWGEDSGNPAAIGGITGMTTPVITISRPTVQGDYFFSLIATDADGNSDTTRSYFTVGPTPPILPATLSSVPRWVREGRMYLMFFKMHTATGTINAALPDLNRIAAMGYNILWVLPVMKNRDPINNGPGPGYNIVDFMTVAPEYGTNDDMKSFVDRAHQLGIKVILDITPNHTSSSHPFVLDARMFREGSRYWTYYQHQIIPYSGPGLGELSQSITADGFVYYGGFSDALLNYNWADVDARQYMIDVYKYWIRTVGVDGYRFDVYWGPFTRTNSPNGGSGEMGIPVRQALKHMRPDIHLLGEASGTGPGTERLYADYAGAGGPGGVEAAYDWNLKGYLQSGNFWSQDPATRVNNLDTKLRNGSVTSGMGFLPGVNSSYLRFLENQDEDRIAYLFGNGVGAATARARTMPVSTALLLAVGLPQVYAGQEVGRGYGIADFDVRRRGVVDFGDPAGMVLMPHYQKLAQIKKQFPAFSTQEMVRVSTDNGAVYAYTRPWYGQNGVIVTNLDSAAHTVTVTLTNSGMPASVLGITNGITYVATDLYNANATQDIVFTAGSGALALALPAYGSAVYVIDSSPRTLVLPSLTAVIEHVAGTVPYQLALAQNYPNPFNPVTTIHFDIPVSGNVSLKVYDLLGREIASLADGNIGPGRYAATWNGRNDRGAAVGSGVYFYRLTAPGESGGEQVLVRKMIVLK